MSESDRNSDRWRAVFVLFPELESEMTHNLARLQFGEEAEGQIDRIAASWATEREKARAPFLALAEELEGRGRENERIVDPLYTTPETYKFRAQAFYEAADRIRRAAEEGRQ